MVKTAFKMKIQRKQDSTEIYLESPTLESLMKDWSNGKTYNPVDQEGDPAAYVSGYRAYTVVAPVLPSGRRNWGSFGNGINAGGFNLRLLTLVGLGEGITLKLHQPLSRTMIRDLMGIAQTSVTELLNEYAKPVEATLTLVEAEKDLRADVR